VTARFSQLARNPLVRWIGVAVLFYLFGLLLLRTMIEVLKLPLTGSTLVIQEVTVIIRYAVNDRWVFDEKRLSWTRLWQFHIASLGGAAVWLILTNVLSKLGVNYLLASTIGTASSMLVTMASNFLWIWHKRSKVSTGEVEPPAAAVEAADA
jgi:putative flippase GtrA